MSEIGLSRDLLKYADQQINAAKEKNSDVMPDLQQYHVNALRKKVWEEVKAEVLTLQKKYVLDEGE